MSFKRTAYGFIAVALLLGACFRIIAIVRLNPHFVDFFCFIDAAQALMRGADPHHLENLRYTQWNEAPLVYPGLAVFFIPFALIGPDVAKYIFYVLNVAVGVLYYTAVVRAARLSTRTTCPTSDAQLALVALGAFLFVNSMFFTLCIRGGQISLFASLFFILTVIASGEMGGTLAFAMAALMKYSNVPVLGLFYFVVRRRFRFCVTAFLIFAFVSFSPALFGHNLLELYRSYYECMMRWVSPGAANSFAMSGHTMISSGLFKFMPTVGVNVVLLAAFLLAGLRQPPDASRGLSLHAIFAMACVTLCLEYHRLYDGVLVYPFLLIETWVFIAQRNKLHAMISIGFVLVFAMPGALMEKMARCLGQRIGENPVLHLPDGQFPLPSAIFLAMTLYALYLYAFCKTDIAFGHAGDAAGADKSQPNRVAPPVLTASRLSVTVNQGRQSNR